MRPTRLPALAIVAVLFFAVATLSTMVFADGPYRVRLQTGPSDKNAPEVSFTIPPLIQQLDSLCHGSAGATYQVDWSEVFIRGGETVYPSLSITVTYQKPNLFLLSASHGGKLVTEIVSGPKMCYILDAANSCYSEMPAPHDLGGLVYDVFYKAPPGVYEPVMDAFDTLRPYNTTFGFNGGDFGNTTMEVSYKRMTLSGHTVTHIHFYATTPPAKNTPENFPSAYDIYLDTTTHLPVQVELRGDERLNTLIYSSFQLLSSPVPDSTFEFTPPAGAKPYTSPSQSPPQKIIY